MTLKMTEGECMCVSVGEREGGGGGGKGERECAHIRKTLLSPRENSLVGVGSKAGLWTKAGGQTDDGMGWEGERREVAVTESIVSNRRRVTQSYQLAMACLSLPVSHCRSCSPGRDSPYDIGQYGAWNIS